MSGLLRLTVLTMTAALAVGYAGSDSVTIPAEDRARLSVHTQRLWDAGADRFHAVVHLAPAPGTRLALAPRGVEQPKARLAAVRESVARTVEDVQSRLGATDFALRHAYRLRPRFAADVSRDGLITLLADPDVVYIEEAAVWRTHTQEGLSLINADRLHDLGFSGQGQAIAIIDTGVDANHPTMGGGPIPNGKVVYGLDTSDNDSDPADCDGHGTAVASVAAGASFMWDSTTRFAGGVAPGATILAYKASPDEQCGRFDSRDVVAAIEDAILHRDEHGVVAINMSIGGEHFGGPCDGDFRLFSYAEAVNDATEAGIAVVVSSGNEAQKGQLGAPACLSNAISVASVYDQSLLQISYCGDNPGGSCSPFLCTDSNPPSGSVTCYSNTNSYLDVFAPSEIETVAEAGGTITDQFGGTSGAAPYVAGAIALLHDAVPGLDPVTARFRLSMTGHPVRDSDNGVVRPLIDLQAASTLSDVAVGEPGVPIPNATGTPAVSTAHVDQNGFVKSVRVTVKVVHGRPRQLVISLVSPDGARVKLHDHDPGTTDESEDDYLLGATGVYAAYPDDRTPAQSLDGFIDSTARGTWTLEVMDDDPGVPPGASPRIVGWAVQIESDASAQPPSGGPSSFFVPVAAHASGSNQTSWATDVRVFNPSLSDDAPVRLYLVPEGSDGSVDFRRGNITVPARTVVDLPDIVLEQFGAGNVQGNLLFEAMIPGLVATSRTYNTGGDSGTYGQFIGVVRPTQTEALFDSQVTLLQLASGADFRTNIGFSETSGSEATVAVTLRDGNTGSVLGSPGVYSVKPFSNTQVNNVFPELAAGESSNAYATVQVIGGNGRITCYGSVVDNVTGDAIAIPAGRPVTAPGLVVPIAAKVQGQAGTNWVTDVRAYNGGTETVDVRIEYRPQLGSRADALSTVVTVHPGHVLAADDVLGSLYGLESGTGSLRLVPSKTDGALLVTSRTYNQTESGTYGQFIGAVADGFTATDRVTVIHLDKNLLYRSNLGVCEVAGGTVQIRYVLKNATGATLGVDSLTLGPYQVKQINDVYGELGVIDQDNTRVEFFMDSGDGAYTAYASVIDNTSGDAMFIPASSW